MRAERCKNKAAQEKVTPPPTPVSTSGQWSHSPPAQPVPFQLACLPETQFSFPVTAGEGLRWRREAGRHMQRGDETSMRGAFGPALSTDITCEAGNSLLPFPEASSSAGTAGWVGQQPLLTLSESQCSGHTRTKPQSPGFNVRATESEDVSDPLGCREQVTAFGPFHH